MNATEDNFPTDFVAAHQLRQQLVRELGKPLVLFRDGSGNNAARAARHELALRLVRLRRHLFTMQQSPAAPVLDSLENGRAQRDLQMDHFERRDRLNELVEANPEVAAMFVIHFPL